MPDDGIVDGGGGGIRGSNFEICIWLDGMAEGPGVVVRTAAFHARIWGSFPGLSV